MPDRPIAFKGSTVFFFDCIEEKRDDGAFCNLLANVSLCIKGSHLFLIDMLFEDVDKYIRSDNVLAGLCLIIQLPVVSIEEGEYALKCFVSYLDGSVVALNPVLIEKIDVEERYITCESTEIR